MATKTDVSSRIERSLIATLAEVEDLPALATEWDTLAEGVRASLSLEWDHLMADYLTELDEYFRAGQMTSDQPTRYRALLCKLKAALPIIEQLNLYRPPVALDGAG
ncbi:MAG: hypothetical protein HY690_08830 [Chloroflexi bacterium]|nr:hypothetical protein [Chloroflexota bacterium]